jgi:hypothetical protein
LTELPSILPDVPVSTIFLAFFLLAGVGHMLRLKSNRLQGKELMVNFTISGMFSVPYDNTKDVEYLT